MMYTPLPKPSVKRVPTKSSFYCVILLTSLIAIVCTLCLVLNCWKVHDNFGQGFRSQEWNLILFSKQWPITTCLHHKEHSASSRCNLNEGSSWTIHGLWPSKLHSHGPSFCNHSWHFNESLLSSIERPMSEYWTNVYADTPKDSLWEHEWDKHGTCAAQLPQLDSEYKYFHQGLKWTVLHNTEDGLALYKIMPDNLKTYSIDDIFSTLIELYGNDPIVDCLYYKGKQLLSQIKLCFNTDLQMISCVTGEVNTVTPNTKRGNCNSSGVYYPLNINISTEFSTP